MHSVKYSNQANADLDEAISYIAKESVANALEYLTKYEKKIEVLRLNPFMGAECNTKLIKRECRVLVHESHIIIYKVDTNLNEISIIRIFHSREKYSTNLNGNDI